MRIRGSHLKFACGSISGQGQHGIKPSMYLIKESKWTLSNSKSVDQQIYSESMATISSYELPQIRHTLEGNKKLSNTVFANKNYDPIISQTFNRQCE